MHRKWGRQSEQCRIALGDCITRIPVFAHLFIFLRRLSFAQRLSLGVGESQTVVRGIVRRMSMQQHMITLGPLLVFVVAASLPIVFLLIVSRWIEVEYRRANREREPKPGPLTKSNPAEASDKTAASPMAQPQRPGAPRPRGSEHQPNLHRMETCYDSN